MTGEPLLRGRVNGVAGMARGAAVDRRASPASVLRQMRGDVDLAEFGDEVAGVEALVCAEGDRVRAVSVRRDQVQRGQPLGMARGRVAAAPTIRPFRFSISAWPMKQSLASLPGPLRNSLASGSVVEACVSLLRF